MKKNNAMLQRFTFGLICVALVAACGGGVTAKAGDTPTQHNSTGTTKPESAEVSEAMKQAVECAGKHWMLNENGALWFGHVDQSFFAINVDVQFKPVIPKLVTKELSEADRLNGVEWRGAVKFSAPAYRKYFAATQSWGDWEPWNLGTFWNVTLEKRNGKWTANEDAVLLRSTRSGGITMNYFSVKSRKPTTEQKP